MAEIPQCTRCGHIFYEGGSGLCHWCVEEIDLEKDVVSKSVKELLEDENLLTDNFLYNQQLINFIEKLI